MAKVIGLIQAKGGAGRSTIATNLAASLAAEAAVFLIECDLPQATSASWGAIRGDEKRLGKLAIATASDPVDLAEKVNRLQERCQYIVIDGPPRVAGITESILDLSSLSLIPLGASAAEIWATTDLLQTIEQIKARRSDVDARILWTRYRWQTRSARELSESLSSAVTLPVMDTRLGYRVAYSEVLARGLYVGEWPDRAASTEFRSLLQEIKNILHPLRPLSASAEVQDLQSGAGGPRITTVTAVDTRPS